MLAKLDPDKVRRAEAAAERKWGADWKSKRLDTQLAHLIEPALTPAPLRRQSYLLAVAPQRESKVEEAMRDKGFDVFLPREPKSIRMNRHDRKMTMRPMLTGYMFPIFDEYRERWQIISKIDGVLRLFLYGERPVPVPEEAVQRLRDRETQEKVRCEVEARRLETGKGPIPLVAMPGDFVQIEDGGSWQGFIGEVVDLISGARLLVVELNIFGRKTRTKVPVEFARAL